MPEPTGRIGLSAFGVRLASFLAACGQCFSSATHGTTIADARLPDWRQSHLVENNLALQSIYNFAVCSLDRKRAASLALLGSAFGSKEQEEAIRIVAAGPDNACLWTSRRMTLRGRSVVRGAFAEAFYNGSKMRPLTADGFTLKQSFQDYLAASAVADTLGAEPASDELVARWAARCTAHRSPMAVHKMLQFNPSSAAELAALNALKPIMLECLPSGRNLLASRLGMRAMLAEGLYEVARDNEARFARVPLKGKQT